MSKIVEMVKNGQQVTTEELFNTVNSMENWKNAKTLQQQPFRLCHSV